MLEIRVDPRDVHKLSAVILEDGKRYRRALSKEFRRAGNLIRREFRAQFGPRVTDPTSRRRTDQGSTLGRFSGKAKSSIRVRLRFPKGSDTVRVFVGPPGGAGAPGSGFYLAFHEFGDGSMPVRKTAAIAERRTRAAAFAQVEQALAEFT